MMRASAATRATSSLVRTEWNSRSVDIFNSLSLLPVADRDTGFLTDGRFRSRLQLRSQPSLIELSAPLRDDDGRNAVAHQIGERPRLRHEAIDAEDECDARGRQRTRRR